METKETNERLNRFSSIALALAVLFFVFGSGYRLGEFKGKKQVTKPVVAQTVNLNQDSFSATADTKVDMSLYWKVWNVLGIKYVDQEKIDKQKLLFGAIKGMVEAVGDPYTYFMTPKQNEEAKADLEGKYEGIGAQLGMRENLILVVAPLKDSPAEAAGVKAGDIIVAVDGKSTKGWTISEAVSKIRGKENTIVKLGLVRNEKDPVNLEIKRQQIKVSSVELSFVKSAACKQECPKVALLKLSQFGDDTDAAWDKAVLEINDKWRKKEIIGMVLDLRNNPGGYLEASVYLSSEFLEVGKQIVRQEYADKSGKDYIVERTGKLVGIPLSILINQGSASAAEIMSGALRDHNKAVLVGKKSFGKGSVQEALDLDEGTGLHVTIAKWILPNGDWIHGKGIKPDIDVENKTTDGNTLTDETDAQLQGAISEALK